MTCRLFSMTFRCRHKLCRSPLLCFWLVLIFVVVMVVFMDPLFTDLSKKTASSRYRQRHTGLPDFEVLDSRDQREGGVSPLGFLKDDQLIIAPSTFENGVPAQKASYKMTDAKKTSVIPLPTRGQLGKPVKVKSEGVKKDTSGIKNQGFNEGLSERISLHRRLPEMRHPACLAWKYSASLPTATVVICFHDEAWSTLLRTVHSVLDTAPKPLLREILLVDDLSQLGHLKSTLGEYVTRLEGVRLVRSTRRLGVAGCRTLGAARALGDVLVFLDSHCECHQGWLEPLLERVASDKTRVVSPVIDAIDRNTFQYNTTHGAPRGSFDWKLDFHWELLSEQGDQGQPIEPIRSPALGGVLAIDKHFFQRIGAYDPGMVLWGAENIELSIRVWLCGGSLEVIPCSRVAHLGHAHLSYTLPDDDTLDRNKVRVAETWLDEHRKVFYNRNTGAYFIWRTEGSNCTDRLKLRTGLGCKNFQWYLSNVHPDQYVPEDQPGFSGELYNVGTGCCADYQKGGVPRDWIMVISPCTGNGNQHCEMNFQRQVRWGSMGQLCLDARGERVVLSVCPPKRRTSSRLQWNITKDGQIVHLLTEKCIEAVKKEDGPHGVRNERSNVTRVKGGLFLRPCTSDPRQQWHFEQLVDLRAP